MSVEWSSPGTRSGRAARWRDSTGEEFTGDELAEEDLRATERSGEKRSEANRRRRREEQDVVAVVCRRPPDVRD